MSVDYVFELVGNWRDTSDGLSNSRMESEWLNTGSNGCFAYLLQRFNERVSTVVYQLMRFHFKRLPLCAFLHNAMVHACIPIQGTNLENINDELQRFMVWSDLHKGSDIRTARGARSTDECSSVGTDLVFTAMAKHSVKFMIRGHQYTPVVDVKQRGLHKIVTIASSPYANPLKDSTSFVTLTPEHLSVHHLAPSLQITTPQCSRSVLLRVSSRDVVQVAAFYGRVQKY
jgi:hypothetical protein